MKTRLLENPFGTWNQIPELNESASREETREFDRLWDETSTVDLSESEVSSYLEKLNTNVLNEAGYGEHGWFGVSPFAWTEGFRVKSIFKPLKWLALPLIGGVVLLLAGLWKLLKEGKKQIAIAKVRAWIEKLVVVADSGLKKTRNTKDSLFLIRQRYRRDILQNAVKVATCLGIDIPEKDDKPQEVETSLNESYLPDDQIIVVSSNGSKNNFFANITFKSKKTGLQIEYVFFKDNEGKIFVQRQYKNGENSYREIPIDSKYDNDLDSKYRPVVEIIDNYLREFSNNTKSENAPEGALIKIIEDGKIEEYAKPGDELSGNGINTAWSSPDSGSESQGSSINSSNDEQGKSVDTEDETKIEDPKSDEDKSKKPGENTNSDRKIDLNSEGLLPDDSRVDWSLMNSIRASQWFGLKHKTTDFWKEAKSVAKVNVSSAQGNPLRECGLITAYVSQSLTLVANSGVAQSYSSIMNKYIETLTKFKTNDRIGMPNGTPTGRGRFGNLSDSKYAMFADDFKIFESHENDFDLEGFTNDLYRICQDQEFTKFLFSIGQNDLLFDFDKTKDPNRKVILAKRIQRYYNEYLMKNGKSPDFANVENMINTFGHGQVQTQDQKPLDFDTIDNYLIAALSKILANTDYTQWQMHSDAYNQMIKFINELTKTVHTVIDSVAKKVEERIGSSGNTFEQAVLRFISSKPDAKQNRSLKNLWDNIGVSKLQQRTIVHCQEIDQSPEMQYYLDMFMITVPKIIKEKLGVMKAEGQEMKEMNK